MHRVVLICEDIGHEYIIAPIVNRICNEYDITISIRVVKCSGSRIYQTLDVFLSHIRSGEETAPDLMIVAVDANCKGYNQRREQLQNHITADLSFSVIHAIPDPHIERWLLIDSHAFRVVLGKGCDAPDQKCDRDRYKVKLTEAILNADVIPLIGGLEHAEDIVREMNFTVMDHHDTSFHHFLTDLNTVLNQWRAESHH